MIILSLTQDLPTVKSQEILNQVQNDPVEV